MFLLIFIIIFALSGINHRIPLHNLNSHLMRGNGALSTCDMVHMKRPPTENVCLTRLFFEVSDYAISIWNFSLFR